MHITTSWKYPVMVAAWPCCVAVLIEIFYYFQMETDSPIRKPSHSSQPISKKLFHSPMSDSPTEQVYRPTDRARKAKKRKQILLPNSSEKIKKAYVKECEGEGYSPDVRGGMRKRVLISLFHNKEYSMDIS